MTPASLSWLDYSEADQRRAREIIAMFSQRESRDELGLGRIRDALSDTLFPGTSVLLTRARYFLFVPWLFREGARRGRVGSRLASWVEHRERELIGALRNGGDLDGLIGRFAGVAVQNLPSTIYWISLRRFGILRHQGTVAQVVGLRQDSHPPDDATEFLGFSDALWAPSMPDPPSNFFSFERCDFDLTRDEATWLAERIVDATPGTLLQFLVARGYRDLARSEFVWELPEISAAPGTVCEAIDEARRFSTAMHGAMLLYNVLLAERAEAMGLSEHEGRRDHYVSLLRSWCREIGATDIGSWDLNGLWALVATSGRPATLSTRYFVTEWIDRVRQGVPHDLSEDRVCREQLRKREYQQKRGQARLRNDRLMQQWGGAAGTGRLNFRWPFISPLLEDIAKARGAAVLAPDNRTLLLDELRPPAGHVLDRAVATTFTLDLATALMVPLAFAGFRFDEQPDPIEVMEALRSTSGRISVFCQAGAIAAAGWPGDLLALLENAIHEVRRPRPGHIFHPKVWALRFLDGTGEPSFRLLVSSRNLTTDRSWDTMLRLDGRFGEGPLASNADLSRFIAALPGLTASSLTDDDAQEIEGLARDLELVQWDLPNGAWEVHFHPIGLPGSSEFPVEECFSGYRRLAISPYVREGALGRIFGHRNGPEALLVSRGEELSALPATSLKGMEVFEFDPTAGLAEDDHDGEEGHSFLTHLHTKIFAVERARRAHLFVGSSNATDAGFAGNVEFLCELVGRVSILGIDALVGESAPLRAMLAPYVAPETPQEETDSAAERALDALLVDIAAGARFRTTLLGRDGEWAPRIRSDAALPVFQEDTVVTIAAYNRPAETRPLDPGQRVDFELQPRKAADVTPFLRLAARRRVEGKEVTSATVVCSRLEGAPDERFQDILAQQVDTPEKFLRLLSLLIGFAARSGGDLATSGDASGGWTGGSSQGVLELLARALAERPESIDHLAQIVDRLRDSPGGREILPQGWDDVWVPLAEARRAMSMDEP